MMRSDRGDIIDLIRSNLPDDIHLYGLFRVTKSFHSLSDSLLTPSFTTTTSDKMSRLRKQMTTSREYEYLLPTFMFRSPTKEPGESAAAEPTDKSAENRAVADH